VLYTVDYIFLELSFRSLSHCLSVVFEVFPARVLISDLTRFGVHPQWLLRVFRGLLLPVFELGLVYFVLFQFRLVQLPPFLELVDCPHEVVVD